ncbi:hypothetical protein G647_09314 [Cladophialophora carrionii CBS 160.54]|uniref:Uncharacterized protein n=1 Tax=Cladophialophora carrionii CBS 160.54 TaxID=1279043 RepID=V9CXW0_9EURO|nr:uncharacterized protein G647_09314 [Cladophialophora carrionii CBS 160.54]ETI19480.1 hypothetical protein G647_09314 [Cladophialophora carrionii CBS 160.54]
MKASLYDSSWTVYSIPQITPSLSKLVSAPATTLQAHEKRREQLASHAESFREYLDESRPRHERDDEKTSLGGLKHSLWTRLDNMLDQDEHPHSPVLHAGKKRPRQQLEQENERTQSNALVVCLAYEKETYKFIIYTTSASSARSSKRRRTASPTSQSTSAPSTDATAILLAKSSPATLKRFTTYLSDRFSVDAIRPLSLSSLFLQSSLERYVSTVPSALLGQIRLTLPFARPIAPDLKSLEIAVPRETTESFTKVRASQQRRSGPRQTRGEKLFMHHLANSILNKTGLSIPVICNVHGGEDSPVVDPQRDTNPARISKVSTVCFALSAECRLKFERKAVEAAEGVKGVHDEGKGEDAGEDDTDPDPDGAENCVKRANRELLAALVDEARRQVRDESNPSDSGG